MSLGTAMKRVAKTLATKLGTPMTLRRVTLGAYDRATGKPATVTTSEEAVRGVLETYSAREVGGAIQAGDVKATIPADLTGAAPAVKDRLVVDAVEYEVVNVFPIVAADQTAAYTLQVRR